MNKLLRSFLILLLLAGVSNAQVSRQDGRTAKRPLMSTEARPAGQPHHDRGGSSNATPQEIVVGGATQMSLRTWYPFQSSGRALHNIQVDPSNPQRIHAIAMAEPNPGPLDSSAAEVWPGRRVYYMFSADGGATWSEPTSVSSTRAGYPDMILYKKGNDYLPIIAMHRREQGAEDNYSSAIFIGTGVPGAGTFTEVSTDRIHADGGDPVDIIWPCITLSPDQTKIYIVASPIREVSTDPYRRMQFSSFDLNTGAGTATWNGPWVNGPGDDLSGLITGGGYVVRTSASGKVGIIWMAEADANQNVYFAESTDGGQSWSSTIFPIYERVGVESSSSSLLTPGDGLDMFYDGETAQAIWTAYALLDDGSGSYYPSLGTLMYWRNGMPVPIILVAREGFVSDLDDPLYPLADLGFFGGETSVQPQNANIEGSSMALSQHPKKWSVYFMTWREGDTSQVYEFQRSEGAEIETESYVYRSLQYITTTDGGETWGEPVLFRGNDIENVDEAKLDYRYPTVSTWNPQVNNNQVQYNVMYTVDTVAGLWVAGGTPTWSEMAYFHEKKDVTIGDINSVRQIGTSDNMMLGQNYPNPFNPSTSISFTVKNPTKVTLTVEDMMGRTVATVYDGYAFAGSTPVKFDASELSAGTYQYVLKSENESVARRMVLTK